MLFCRVSILTTRPQNLRSTVERNAPMITKNVTQSPKILKVRQDRQYDCVYLNGKKIILGRSGTPEADAAFRKLQIQVLTDPTLSANNPQQVAIDSLCLAYLQYASEHNPSHFYGIRTAIAILLKHFTGQAVEALDSRSLLYLQEQFVLHGVSRKYHNRLVRPPSWRV